MPNRILLLSFLLCLSTGVFAQTTGVKRATFSSTVGSSTYPQSIGQSSVVIGASRVKSYDLLQGLQPGRNLKWNFNAERRLAEKVQLSFVYDGRRGLIGQPIHTGRVMARYIF
jgi:hypothetical protein